ncbi:hypothetical protein AG4045_024200 [Apium graveolens]|uniref:MSP domain-containing protein n=1 Tax=Apium graveolens TaxID=4045 RepID=A0A6L5B9Q3_APIGR|nr:hypothetical protein AG4045_024200 [Apium graveolens]
MDRLISLEPSNLVAIRIEQGQRCFGELTLRNVMHTMPVAFRLQPMDKNRYTIRPQSGIISPLATLTVQITYESPPHSLLPESFPYCDDTFLLHSVVVPAASGETLIVELLLAHRASMERSESSTWGPIHLAAGGGHVEILKLLLLKNANVNALTKDGNTALHIAVEERRRDCARQLLTYGARADIRNSDDGDTPLHIAAALGDDHMIKLLLQKGANKDIRNKVGKTAYDVAAEHGHNRLFDALRLGESLSIAARKGEVRTMQRLLENGACINGLDQHGWTALHRASFKGWVDAVRTLIEKGIDINAKDEDGYTALHCAVESGHVEVIEVLVKKGADVESKTNKGVAAIQIAEALNYSGITRILVYGGATKNGSASKHELPPTTLVSFGKGKREQQIMDKAGIKKKTVARPRSVRSSYDRTRTATVM